MVSLGVPTAVFGNPPDPNVPQPHYPGISSRKYDPLSALIVYREALAKERDLAANGKDNLNAKGGPYPHVRYPVDIMPGLSSLNDTYRHLGYIKNAATGVPEPPVVKFPPPEPEELSSQSSGARSTSLPTGQRRVQKGSRPASAASATSRQVRPQIASRPASAGSSHGGQRRTSRPGSSSVRRSASATELHWDSPKLPEFKSHFEPPQGGVCKLMPKDFARLAAEKAIIQKNCGQNRVLCFC
mmetsp:Transcript_14927/g.26163  ORF Transcript_14927/g.26163 Transcript_14927/m.26163 type:complete len:242 (-) Transcript_14927:32-757(-)|eukprot:CAMPEP_0197655644 /NCGR_PEP_ID=MMETSP1338-20131121/39577_1 /TAXON_ID=43686 ORGANISM="Pelagodinium beii, Strain RCC1491" /NCGR_SAMPLE_ID=MMETSP1338 /ASSEMBLY_ACC=CAM_ASM_000754 /LENGTH=241 /DNA_ID=CAMNT_0043231329 /DNA_START=73 /DNA_END=798 /DNA_ORIENTATION=-